MLRLGCLCPRSRVPEVAREAGRGPLALPGSLLGNLLGFRDFSGRVILRPGLLDLLVPTEDQISLLTCLTILAPPLVCIELSCPLTFGLRSVPSSFGDEAYFGKFQGTSFSVRDDPFLFFSWV